MLTQMSMPPQSATTCAAKLRRWASLADVPLDDDHAPAGVPDRGLDDGGLVRLAEVGEGDVGAGGGESRRRRRADAPRAARDHGALAGEVEGSRHQSVRYSSRCRCPVSCERTIASQISAHR